MHKDSINALKKTRIIEESKSLNVAKLKISKGSDVESQAVMASLSNIKKQKMKQKLLEQQNANNEEEKDANNQAIKPQLIQFSRQSSIKNSKGLYEPKHAVVEETEQEHLEDGSSPNRNTRANISKLIIQKDTGEDTENNFSPSPMTKLKESLSPSKMSKHGKFLSMNSCDSMLMSSNNWLSQPEELETKKQHVKDHQKRSEQKYLENIRHRQQILLRYEIR
jgi:hypothetical protein